MLNVAIGGQNKVTILFVVEDETRSVISQLPWMVLESILNGGLWLAVSFIFTLFFFSRL